MERMELVHAVRLERDQGDAAPPQRAAVEVRAVCDLERQPEPASQGDASGEIRRGKARFGVGEDRRHLGLVPGV
jgi:hypothetical protein